MFESVLGRLFRTWYFRGLLNARTGRLDNSEPSRSRPCDRGATATAERSSRRRAGGRSRHWVQRLTVDRRRRDLGLAGYSYVRHDEARAAAFANRRRISVSAPIAIRDFRLPVPPPHQLKTNSVRDIPAGLISRVFCCVTLLAKVSNGFVEANRLPVTIATSSNIQFQRIGPLSSGLLVERNEFTNSIPPSTGTATPRRASVSLLTATSTTSLLTNDLRTSTST